MLAVSEAVYSMMIGTPGEMFELQLGKEVAIMQILSNVEDIPATATLKEVKDLVIL